MPGAEDFERAEAGEFALGGCCVPPDLGTVDYWACRACGHQYPVLRLVNNSPVGRLLEEISWEGNARPYRNGGRGRENVLTTEVFTLLDWLPRQAFLGAILAAAHGADPIRAEVAAQVESMTVSVLPGDVHGERADGSPTPWSVQPDVRLESWRAALWVEAKRIRPASFQPHQLARTLHALLTTTGDRLPLLLLVLGAPPPIRVARVGTLDIPDAVEHSLALFDDQQDLLTTGAREAVAWLTWTELALAVRRTPTFSTSPTRQWPLQCGGWPPRSTERSRGTPRRAPSAPRRTDTVRRTAGARSQRPARGPQRSRPPRRVHPMVPVAPVANPQTRHGVRTPTSPITAVTELGSTPRRPWRSWRVRGP
jgi:hypothetical protein